MMVYELMFFLVSWVGSFLFFSFSWELVIFMFTFLMIFLSSLFSFEAVVAEFFFLDNVSINLSILSCWISMLMVFSSFKIFKVSEFFFEFSLFVVLLSLVLLVTFFVSDLFSFYFFFEVSILPTVIIIMGWGYQPERVQASFYFFFYTLVGSIPLLFLVLYLASESFVSILFYGGYLKDSVSIFLFIFFSAAGATAFLVKMPMFFVHLWLPKAHVEAPVAGSMILAAVLLKLGGYGAMRVSYFLGQFFLSVKSYIYGLSLMSMIFVGFICCRLNDMKALVAYSSVAHMAMVICGCATLSKWGFMGSFIMLVAHGLSSSGLFCMVNLYYERSLSRSLFLNKGLITIFPLLTFLIFLLCAANIAAPPTINLLSEIILMISLMKLDYFMILVFPLGSFLGAVFTLFLFSYTQHGSLYFSNYSVVAANFREFHILILHIIPLNYLFMNSALFLEVSF